MTASSFMLNNTHTYIWFFVKTNTSFFTREGMETPRAVLNDFYRHTQFYTRIRAHINNVPTQGSVVDIFNAFASSPTFHSSQQRT